jgi:hypothetical protein
MKISKYVKLNRDVLLEYVYNNENLISEPYQVLVNIKDNITSFISPNSSTTNNILNNQLFKIDTVNNKLGKVDTTNYSFLQLKDYATSIPVRYDTVKIHVPINWTFGEYIGFYLRIYTFDYRNKKYVDLTNFYFDITDVTQSYLLNYSSPPLLFQEKLWGKYIDILIPSVNQVSLQREDGLPKENSMNSNLAPNEGLSQNSPIFIDFQFLAKKQTVNGVDTFISTTKTTTTISQVAEFESMGVMVEESTEGDFFEIYGTYNGNIGEFNQFIQNSIGLGNRYYVEYDITIYEQNIKGKTTKVVVMDDFIDKVEYRPIIKYSTTTAVIDVEMKLIDAVDDSVINRRASYGMLQDEISKYSLNLTKINLKNAWKPKIYNLKNISTGLIDNLNGQIVFEKVEVPFPVLIDRLNVIAKSKNVQFSKDIFYGMGLLKIVIYPFDNVIKFNIATDIDSSVKYMDLTNLNDLKLTIKNDNVTIESPIYLDTDENNLSIGQIVFKINSNKYTDIKRVYNSGNNIFYITTTNQNITTVVYTGLFIPYDNLNNVIDLNNDSSNADTIGDQSQSQINIDNSLADSELAIVTRRRIQVQSGTTPLGTGGNNIVGTASTI